MNPEGDREEQYRQYLLEKLARKYGASRLPTRIKKQEAPYDRNNNPTQEDFRNEQGVSDAPVRLNAFWYDLTEQGGGLQPNPGVEYLWVVRDDGHLVIGVEDPSKFTEAFPFLNGDKSMDGLGHPTIAATFGAKGETQPGKGRIAGELKDAGGWLINDHSGRYGSGRGDTVDLLLRTAKLFGSYGIEIAYIQSKAGTDDAALSVDEARKLVAARRTAQTTKARL
ncbi:hypothetical protein [Actinophytocola sp.]|uniref:hypothetical protein n=1 Tax=Actinophytocola sp. TaxID=1872138 RepID=UPI002D7F4C5C|nr:hypothetical protein [Actinophytocola sp.]HET9141798.1 hypothetical protein [Actinophytocola sp.]